MQTQRRVCIFFDFSIIQNAEQIAKFQDFVKNCSSDIECKSYNQSSSAGFDARLVADMLIGAHEDKYDEVIVVSSDTDLAPAINYIRNRLGKKVFVFTSVDDLII